MKKVLSITLSLIFSLTLIPLISLTANALDYHVEAAIQWAIDTANDNKHGYSQARRNGPDYDCSSLVSTAFKMGGFPVSGTLTTRSMTTPFLKAGFTRYKKGEVNLQRGDVLLKPGSHVELYLGNDFCVGAHSNYDKRTGDSSGKEIAVRKIDKCNFCKKKGYTYILRYEKEEVLEMIPGDMNLDGIVDIEDALRLLFSTNFPEYYPSLQPSDFDGDFDVDMDDAIYLLFHVNFPCKYTLEHLGDI